MDGINITDFRSTDNTVCPKVAIATLGSTDTDSLIGQLYVERLNIRFRVNGESLDPQFAAGPHDA